MTATLPAVPGPDGRPHWLDPIIDAPLTGPRVLQFVGEHSACAMWRVWQPTATLRLHGYPADWAFLHDPRLVEVPLEAYDAVVLCRLSWLPGHQQSGARWFAWLRRRGIRVFYECDDDFFTPFMVEQQHAGIERDRPRAQIEQERRASLWVLRRVDGVTVSTQHLASTVRRFIDTPVEVVPNAIDAGWFLEAQRGAPRTVPGLTIGWAGGHRPDGDLREMAIAWGRLARRYPEVTFVVQGHQPWVISEHVPERRLRRLPWMALPDYPKGLVNVDIACCPLEDTPFNRCKTPIKAWEAALSGAAVVASPTVYRHSIDGGLTGYLASTADDWEEGLSLLIEQDAHRTLVAGRLRDDVLRRWTLARNYWRWPAAWNRLMGAT